MTTSLPDSYDLGYPVVKMLLDARDAILSINRIGKRGTTVKAIFSKYKLVYNAYNKKIRK